MKFAPDAVDDPKLDRPSRLVLIAPMIGITELSRFAGVFGWPAALPAFASAAWLGIVPEFNPFKYNSFPVNGARQSSLLTRNLRAHIAREESAGRLGQLPPILTFQSLVDFTVSTRAIVTGLYSRLPENGSELVLFDLNRNAKLGPLRRTTGDLRLERLLPAPPLRFHSTVLPMFPPTAQRFWNAELQPEPVAKPHERWGWSFRWECSHFLILPCLFPSTMNSTVCNRLNLGALSMRGERGALVVSVESFSRLSSNPFYPYLAERIAQGLPPR